MSARAPGRAAVLAIRIAERNVNAGKYFALEDGAGDGSGPGDRGARGSGQPCFVVTADCLCRSGFVLVVSVDLAHAKSSVEEHRPIQRVPLHGLEARVADDSAQLFFRGAVTRPCGSHHILF